MIPFNLELTITKGLTYGPVIFNFKKQDGTPFPLTGWGVFAHARREKNETVKIDLAPTLTDPDNGVAQIQFTDEVTAEMTASEYGWDMILRNPTGETSGPYFAGPLNVEELYTHDV